MNKFKLWTLICWFFITLSNLGSLQIGIYLGKEDPKDVLSYLYTQSYFGLIIVISSFLLSKIDYLSEKDNKENHS